MITRFFLSLIALCFVCLADLAAAPQFLDRLVVDDRDVYEDVHIMEVKPDSIIIMHEKGIAKVPLSKLSPRMQEVFGYNSQTAQKYKDSQSRKKQQSLQAQETLKKRQKQAIQPTKRPVRIKPAGDSPLLRKFGSKLIIQEEVDLRPRLKDLGLFASKTQGQRPSCSVFAVLAALEFENAEETGDVERFSEEYLLWATLTSLGYEPERVVKTFYTQQTQGGYPDMGFSLGQVLKALQHYGVPLREDFPYTFGTDYNNIQEPPSDVIQKARARRSISAHRLPGQTPDLLINNVMHALNEGVPVIVALRFPETSQLRRVHYLKSQDTLGNHAVTLMGYKAAQADKSEAIFYFKNSWGPKWGLGGYGLVHYDYMKENLLEAYIIQVES